MEGDEFYDLFVKFLNQSEDSETFDNFQEFLLNAEVNNERELNCCEEEKDGDEETTAGSEPGTPSAASYSSDGNSASSSNTAGVVMNLNDLLPEEIWIKILLYCDVKDIISFSLTSKLVKKQIDNAGYLWKLKCYDLLEQHGFHIEDFRPSGCKDPDPLQYRAICVRFASVFRPYDDEKERLKKCDRCKRYTCLQGCVEDGPKKVTVDIGSKTSWLIVPWGELRRHPSILSLPKLVQCVDCGVNVRHQFVSLQNVCDCQDNGGFSQPRHEKYAYKSQPLGSSIQTCCLYCTTRVVIHSDPLDRRLMRGYPGETMEFATGSVSEEVQKLCSGYCADDAKQHKFRSLDSVSPALALRTGGTNLGVATAFLQHLLAPSNALEDLRDSNGILFFCENVYSPSEVRRNLLHFLFTQLRISRVCLVPRPLAVCAELGLKTALVIDSGALHTHVAVVIGGKVVLDRCRELSVGGRHIAESLHYAHASDELSQEIAVSSLDSPEVKDQCRLSQSASASEQQQQPRRSRECTVESIWVPAPNRRNMKIKSWKQISLGNEVFRAPEFMYASMDLPSVIMEVIQGLPREQLMECLGHIALTGGNTGLSGFEQRLRHDLVELLPEFASIIHMVHVVNTTRSSNAAVGASFIPFPIKQGVPPVPPEPGTPLWISRDDFIFYGIDHL